MEGMRQRTIYVHIRGGQFTRQPLPGDPEAQLRTRLTDDNATIEEFFSETLGGRLVSIGVVGSQWGDQLHIKLEFTAPTGIESRTLQMKLDSPAARDVLHTWESIDPTQDVVFNCTKEKIPGDKEISKIFIRQGENYLKYAYTKDTPDGPPKWEAIVISGETQWDRTAYLNWWKARIPTYDTTLKAVAPSAKDHFLSQPNAYTE